MRDETSQQGVRLSLWAEALLIIFLLAVLAALTVTLLSVPTSVRLLASVIVVPIVAVTLLILYYETQGKRWAFAGAALLGAFGISLRLVISTQPSLEVGGGLPIPVTAGYLILGTLVVVVSLWSFFKMGPKAAPG